MSSVVHSSIYCDTKHSAVISKICASCYSLRKQNVISDSLWVHTAATSRHILWWTFWISTSRSHSLLCVRHFWGSDLPSLELYGSYTWQPENHPLLFVCIISDRIMQPHHKKSVFQKWPSRSAGKKRPVISLIFCHTFTSGPVTYIINSINLL